MRKVMSLLLVVMLVMGVMVGMVSAEEPTLPNWNIEGTWTGWSYVINNTFVLNIVKQEANGNLTGTMFMERDDIHATVTGQLSGDEVTFRRDDDGSTYWADVSALITSTQMEGTFIDRNGTTGYFIAYGEATWIEYYKAAPAVAAQLLKEAGVDHRFETGAFDKRGRPVMSNYIAEVAHEMNKTDGTDFQGVPKSSVGEYACKIAAFLNSLGAGVTCTPQYEYVETVTVDSSVMAGANSLAVLENGAKYKFVVSGTWRNRGWEWVDAKYTTGDNWATWTDAPAGGYPNELLDLQVDTDFIDWGAYNSDHIYTYYFVGKDSTVNFRVFDGNVSTNAPNPGWYGDNVGSLTVMIYKANW